MRPITMVTAERSFSDGAERVVVTLAPGAMWIDPMGESAAVVSIDEGRVVVHRRGRTEVLGPGERTRASAFEIVTVRAEAARATLQALHGPRGVHRLASDREPAATAIEPGGVRRARTALEASSSEAPTLDDLAAHAHVSKYHLVRSFRAYHGVPPHAYLLCHRIGRARGLLIDGVRATDVAFETGFADPSHFSRAFRKLMGVTPAEYARLAQERPRSGRHPRVLESGESDAATVDGAQAASEPRSSSRLR